MVLRTVLGLLVATCAVGCSSAPDASEAAADESAITAPSTQTFLLYAKDDATRIACRAVTNRSFCSLADADAHADACTGGSAQTAAHLSAEVKTATCTASAELYPTMASCATPITRHCGFYAACLERALPCGEQGYALGFGERYCTAFRSASLSEKGTAWATGVMGCLQKKLVARVAQAGAFATKPESATVCSAIQEEAFASHPACYTDPAHSICFLPPSDLRKILGVIGAQEIFTKRTSTQIAQTVGVCIGQVTHAIARHLSFGSASPADLQELQDLRERENILNELREAN